MNVAVALSQHSPMFGQLASSHTVCNSRRRSNRLSWTYLGLPGARTRSHRGFGRWGSGTPGFLPRINVTGIGAGVGMTARNVIVL